MELLQELENKLGDCMKDITQVAQETLQLGDIEAQDDHLLSMQDSMLAYVQLKKKINNFQKAFKYVDKASEAEDFRGNPEDALKEMYEELNANISKDELMQDPNYQKIVDLIESGPPVPESDLDTVIEDEENSLVMTQEANIPLDPLTKLPVTDPVRNKKCLHKYDRATILQHIASRKQNARCPVSGCANTAILNAGELEDDVEVKRLINRKRAVDASFFK